jgi:hypothetical protein
VLTLRHVADLVRIPHIPLLSTGTYSLSTGEFTFTLEDLQAAAAAPANDPAVQWPRLKIDGLGDSFDPAAHGGEPAAGRIENMVVEGETLYGDYVVPPGLAAVIDWSFPSRSVEAVTGSMMGPTATGRTHELVITAVALLGVDLPGVSTLPDLMDVLATFSGEAPGQAVVMATVERPSERVEPVDASARSAPGWIRNSSGGGSSTWPTRARRIFRSRTASAAMTCGSGRCASMMMGRRSWWSRHGSQAGCTGTASTYPATT